MEMIGGFMIKFREIESGKGKETRVGPKLKEYSLSTVFDENKQDGCKDCAAHPDRLPRYDLNLRTVDYRCTCYALESKRPPYPCRMHYHRHCHGLVRLYSFASIIDILIDQATRKQSHIRRRRNITPTIARRV